MRTHPKPLVISITSCVRAVSREWSAPSAECLFAHSKIELAVWNAVRQNEPHRALLAHSEEERTHTGAGVMVTGVRRYNTSHIMMNCLDFKCEGCGLTCASDKQLKDHLAGTRYSSYQGGYHGALQIVISSLLPHHWL